MELKVTTYERHLRSAVITFSRPDRGNSWTGRMHAEYRHCIAAAESDPEVRSIVVTGEGKTFCVGGDSDALTGHAKRGSYDDGLAAATQDATGSSPGAQSDSGTAPQSEQGAAKAVNAGYGFHDQFNHQFAYHFGLTKPVIAAINGPAAGVGLALACFADLRFAGPGVKLTTAHGKLNLPPEFGLSWILPRHIGLTRAMDLLLTSRVFMSEEAYEFGLVNRLVDRESLLAETLDYAEQLATTVSSGSLTATRQQVYLDQHRGIGDSVEASVTLLSEMMGQPDYTKGVEALKDKRPPDF